MKAFAQRILFGSLTYKINNKQLLGWVRKAGPQPWSIRQAGHPCSEVPFAGTWWGRGAAPRTHAGPGSRNAKQHGVLVKVGDRLSLTGQIKSEALSDCISF